jgi:hypothetical protein
LLAYNEFIHPKKCDALPGMPGDSTMDFNQKWCFVAKKVEVAHGEEKKHTHICLTGRDHPGTTIA